MDTTNQNGITKVIHMEDIEDYMDQAEECANQTIVLTRMLEEVMLRLEVRKLFDILSEEVVDWWIDYKETLTPEMDE